MPSETCTHPTCGQEVRYGTRDGVTGWLHREAVDHNPMFGHPSHLVDWAAVEAEFNASRTRLNKDEVEEVYTARGHDIAKMKKAARERQDDFEVVEVEIPGPEILARPIELADMPQGARNVIKWATEAGWTWTATYSRGPKVHASQGHFLRMCDYIQVKFRLDGTPRRAVASWEDGSFDFAYLLDTTTHTATRAKSDALKAWIKGEA